MSVFNSCKPVYLAERVRGFELDCIFRIDSDSGLPVMVEGIGRRDAEADGWIRVSGLRESRQTVSEQHRRIA